MALGKLRQRWPNQKSKHLLYKAAQFPELHLNVRNAPGQINVREATKYSENFLTCVRELFINNIDYCWITNNIRIPQITATR
jgi:hypothetical protein